jgi:hypothetical protein
MINITVANEQLHIPLFTEGNNNRDITFHVTLHIQGLENEVAKNKLFAGGESDDFNQSFLFTN